MLEISNRRRLAICQLVYCAFLGVVLLFVWPRGDRLNPAAMQQSGEAFLSWIVWVQVALLMLVAPSVVAASLTAEKEHRSLDLLLLSPLGKPSIVTTKCLAKLLTIGLILASGLPVLVMGMFLGGSSLAQVLWGLGLMAGTGLIAGCAGAASGALFRSFTMALIGAYLFLGVVLGLLPFALSLLWKPFWLVLNPLGMVDTVLETGPKLPVGRWVPALAVGSWVLTGAVLLRVAAWALRSTSASSLGGRAPRRPRNLGLGSPRLRISHGSLMVWRELRGKLPDCTLTPAFMALVLLATVAGLNAILWTQVQDSSTNLLASLGLCFAVVVFSLFVSTASMVNERKRGDLELLLLTDMPEAAIVEGKYRGLFLLVLPMLLLPLLQGVVGAEPVRSVCVCLPVLCAFVPGAILSGMGGGMRSDRLVQALGRSSMQLGQMFALNTVNLLSIVLFLGLVGGVPLVMIGATSEPAAWITFAIAACMWVCRYNRTALTGTVLLSLRSQLEKGGADLEWHGVDWQIGWGRMAASIFFWLGLALFAGSASGAPLGMFALFLLGTVAALGVGFTLVAATRAVREGRRGRREPGRETET